MHSLNEGYTNPAQFICGKCNEIGHSTQQCMKSDSLITIVKKSSKFNFKEEELIEKLRLLKKENNLRKKKYYQALRF